MLDFQFVPLLISIVIMIQIVILYRVYTYKKIIDEKNVKLIQFYLDMKFLWKAIISNLNVSDTSQFCHLLINDIKEYFNLEDIIIVDSIRMVKEEKNTLMRRSVLNFISNNFARVIKKLAEENLYESDFMFKNKRFALYITAITPDVINDGLIVCVEKRPSLLSKHEIISLENCINLLKTRMIYG